MVVTGFLFSFLFHWGTVEPVSSATDAKEAAEQGELHHCCKSEAYYKVLRKFLACAPVLQTCSLSFSLRETRSETRAGGREITHHALHAKF